MTRDEESRVIQAVLAGDTGRFEELVHANERAVYTLCLRMLRDEQDALDASQETFVRAWRGLARFRGESRFSTWLYRLASRICIDMLRRRPKQPELSLTAGDDEDFSLPDLQPSPQQTAEQNELRQLVTDALTLLPPDFREAVILRDVNGLSYDEIGNITGLEPGTVKSRIYRARRKLADILMKNRNFSGYAPSKNTADKTDRKGGADR